MELKFATKYYRVGDGEENYDYREYDGPYVTSIPGTTPMTVHLWRTFEQYSGADERHQWDRFMKGAVEITETEYVKAWEKNLQEKINHYQHEIDQIKARLVGWDGTLMGALKGIDR